MVHIECATDSVHFYDHIRSVHESRERLDRGEISTAQHRSISEEYKSRDIRYQGTAIFLEHEGYRYLLTARHNLWDEESGKREFEEEIKRTESWPDGMRESLLASALASMQSRIYNTIFRVVSLDEVLSNTFPTEFLMNLGAGGTYAYTFSNPEIDLAVISLDLGNKEFADELVSRGYIPVSSSDIRPGPSSEGQEVRTIGFPAATALIGEINLNAADADWASRDFSLPVTSFGRISMLHESIPFYWADMSLYPGNSGGPAVVDDRLVGVVVAQAVESIGGIPDAEMRIPFGKIMKSKYIFELLEEQRRKDEQWRSVGRSDA